MPKIQARWKLRSCVLKCPGCGRYLVAEFVGSWRMRKAKDSERAVAGLLSPQSPESTISYAPARRSALAEVARDHAEGRSDKYGCNDDEPRDEGQERGDGA